MIQVRSFALYYLCSDIRLRIHTGRYYSNTGTVHYTALPGVVPVVIQLCHCLYVFPLNLVAATYLIKCFKFQKMQKWINGILFCCYCPIWQVLHFTHFCSQLFLLSIIVKSERKYIVTILSMLK